MEQAGKVYLVGSGPGDADYLTVQAQALLAEAEVLVYDALVDGDLLDLVPKTCLKLNVGKRGGQPSMAQPEINRLLVQHCQMGRKVVRLKSGDPFVFGRSQAEIEALVAARCDYEVMPGLSSALVAPLLAGIPLTDPELSSSFTVCTAHNPDGLNWVSLAKLETLVILMGGRTLPEIVRRLRGHGKSPKTPIAIIRWAGRAEQQIWEGTLGNILVETANQSLAPCVIVIGEVVKLRSLLQPKIIQDIPSAPRRESQRDQPAQLQPWDEFPRRASDTSFDNFFEQPSARNSPRDRSMNRAPNPIELSLQSREPFSDPVPAIDDRPPVPAPPSAPLPLTDKTILVTRAVSQSSQFTQLLQAQGATVVEMPTLEIGAPSSWQDLDKAIARLDEFDWLILTSTNGVDAFFKRLKTRTGDDVPSCNIKIAAVGEKTAQRLQQLGVPADFVPPKFVADSLASNFPEPLSGLRILFPRVESGGRDVLVKEFANQGAKVREVAAYESRCPDAIAPQALRALRSRSVDVITFASSKTVQHFCQLFQQADDSWQTYLENVCIASIGPQTSESCQSLLGRVDVEATEFTLDGLTAAIVEWATPKVEEPAIPVEITSQITEPTSEPEIEPSEVTPEPELIPPSESLAIAAPLQPEDTHSEEIQSIQPDEVQHESITSPEADQPETDQPETDQLEELIPETGRSTSIQSETNDRDQMRSSDDQSEINQPEMNFKDTISPEAFIPEMLPDQESTFVETDRFDSSETKVKAPEAKMPESEILQPEILEIKRPNQRNPKVKRAAPPESRDLEIKDAEVIAVDDSRINNPRTPPTSNPKF
jgi:uroporphyrinogen III methyltransferase/synthase